MDKLAFKLGFNWFRLLALVAVLLYLSYSTGLGIARSQNEYFTLQGHPNSVVLKISDSKLIWTSYNSETHEVAPSFTVQMLEGGAKFVLEEVEVGPLMRPSAFGKQDQRSSSLILPSSGQVAPASEGSR